MTAAQQTKDKARPGKAGEAKAARQRGGRAKAGSGVTVPVPIVIPRLKVYHPPVPGPSSVGRAGRSVAGRLPPPERLAFYGGLGAAAVFGLIDWPVAAAIGVGTAITRPGRTGDRPDQPKPATPTHPDTGQHS